MSYGKYNYQMDTSDVLTRKSVEFELIKKYLHGKSIEEIKRSSAFEAYVDEIWDYRYGRNRDNFECSERTKTMQLQICSYVGEKNIKRKSKNGLIQYGTCLPVSLSLEFGEIKDKATIRTLLENSVKRVVKSHKKKMVVA